MSITGLKIRSTLRSGILMVLDQLISLLDGPDHASESTAESAPSAEPAPSSEPAPPPKVAPAASSGPPPLPEPPSHRPPLDVLAETPKAKPKKKPSAADRQKKHWERTRKGVLAFVHEQGGRSTLRDMHDHSESTYFVAHVSFSRLMEELTDEGLLDYDHDTAEARLTDEGRAELD